MTVACILNGKEVSVRVRTFDRLADLLRERFGLLGLHADCRRGLCGSCLVLLDGNLTPSCLVPAFAVAGKLVVTIEGFRETREYADIAEAFEEAAVEDCGSCRNAKILAIATLLERLGRPGPAEIAEGLSAVRCRCTDHAQLERVVGLAADRRARRLYRRGR